MSKIIHPAYFRIVKRDVKGWRFRHGKVFYRAASDQNATSDWVENREQLYGLTDIDVIVELFRLKGGAEGYYLANLRDRRYYYCGQNWSDIIATAIIIRTLQSSKLAEGLSRLS